MHFFEFKVDSNTGWRVLKYTLNKGYKGASEMKTIRRKVIFA